SPPSSLSYSPHHPHLHSFPTRRSSDLRAHHNCRSVAASMGVSGWSSASSTAEALENSRSRVSACARRAAAYGAQTSESSSCASRSEEHTSELQSPYDLVCRLLLEKKKK